MSEQPYCIDYLRIFGSDPNPDVQAAALTEAGCTNIYEATEASVHEQLLNFLHDGDKLVVYHLDRLSSDVHTLANLQQKFQAIGVTMVVANMPEAAGGDHEE